jgi:hypothetical protein
VCAGKVGRARRGAVPDVPGTGADAQRDLLQIPGRLVPGHLQRHRDARHQLPRCHVQPGSAHWHPGKIRDASFKVELGCKNQNSELI